MKRIGFLALGLGVTGLLGFYHYLDSSDVWYVVGGVFMAICVRLIIASGNIEVSDDTAITVHGYGEVITAFGKSWLFSEEWKKTAVYALILFILAIAAWVPNLMLWYQYDVWHFALRLISLVIAGACYCAASLYTPYTVSNTSLK